MAEALRAFKLASEADPKAAMPYWGQAYALGPFVNRCRPYPTLADCSCSDEGPTLRGLLPVLHSLNTSLLLKHKCYCDQGTIWLPPSLARP